MDSLSCLYSINRKLDLFQSQILPLRFFKFICHEEGYAMLMPTMLGHGPEEVFVWLIRTHGLGRIFAVSDWPGGDTRGHNT